MSERLTSLWWSIRLYWDWFVLGRGEIGRWCSIVGCTSVTHSSPLVLRSDGGHEYLFRRSCGRCGAPDCGSQLVGLRKEQQA